MKKIIILHVVFLCVIGLAASATHCSAKRHWSKRERFTQKNLLSRHPKELEKKSEYGYTPLAYAVLVNNLKEVRKLLKKGANPRNILAEVRYNTDKPVMLAELLRYGAKVNAKDSSRSTPLHHAVFGNNFYDRLEQLLKVGANPNAQNNDNETPFTRTMGKVYLKRPVQTVNMFLDFQADPLLQDNFGHTAFSLALNTCPEVMLLMVQNEHIWPALKAFNPSAKSMEIVNIVDAKIRQHQNSIARMEVEQDPEGVIDRLRKKWAIDELKNKVAVLESPKKRSELVLDVQRKIQQELCPQFSYAWLMQRQTGFTRKQIMHNTALTHFDFESWLSEREESKED